MKEEIWSCPRWVLGRAGSTTAKWGTSSSTENHEGDLENFKVGTYRDKYSHKTRSRLHPHSAGQAILVTGGGVRNLRGKQV